ncbi:hypothetical protein GCM10010404_61450 [Nonomuraea africana]|uniref:Uncharacterized protein n=1 Tax=Nonomuraea africana TaxID=46171 RepID=A0ABR9K6J0_9ACTN|nr:hypothetical protein [Nonomuraea africana]MBE1557619.1 hypothetical protein [Nonomuraea africana]
MAVEQQASLGVVDGAVLGQAGRQVDQLPDAAVDPAKPGVAISEGLGQRQVRARVGP